MNRPPTEFKRIAAADLRSFGTACLRAAGMSAAHAAQLADLLTNSDLRGVRSHGTRALYGYCCTLRDKKANPTPDIRVLRETDTHVFVDGDGSLGYAPTMLATERAIAKAKEKGLAIGAACHIGHYGSAGHYVRRAMAENCVGFSVQAAYPQYYPSNDGKRAAHYGNPPLCFGVPGQDGPPVVVDVATCILADYQRGEQIEAIEELIPAAFFQIHGLHRGRHPARWSLCRPRRRPRPRDRRAMASGAHGQPNPRPRLGPLRARSTSAPRRR